MLMMLAAKPQVPSARTNEPSERSRITRQAFALKQAVGWVEKQLTNGY
jgi:hypothetical protein